MDARNERLARLFRFTVEELNILRAVAKDQDRSMASVLRCQIHFLKEMRNRKRKN